MSKRILVVDDEIDFTFMMKTVLELTGQYEVRGVNTPAQVKGVAHDFKPDLILLDCMMPGMDGGEVAGSIQSDSTLKSTPFAFLTCTVDAPQVSRSKCYSGPKAYLPKNGSLSSLVSFIETATLAGGACEMMHA